jgi:hypothetical protein
MPAVGTRRQQVHRRHDVEREAQEMDAAPQLVRDPVANERRDLDRRQEVQADDAEGDTDRVPLRRERHEHLGEAEVHVGVAHDRSDVDGGEHEGQAAEEPVQVEEPRPADPALKRLRGHRESPEDRTGEEDPRDDPGRAGHVPRQLCAHGHEHAAAPSEPAGVFL